MQIGFVSSLLWSRWGPFWFALLREAGLEPVRAEPAAVVRALAAASEVEGEVPGTAFAVAVAEARALAGCELIVAPDLNPGRAGGSDGGPGGGQDPWIVDFPTTLARAVPGLPPVRAVPASLEVPVETLALETLVPLLRDPTRVRRAWERTRANARPPRPPGVRWQLRPSELRTVGVVGQPWVVGDALLGRLAARRERDDEHYVAQHQLAPADLRGEGRRANAALIDTDAEAIGAARRFGRRGTVTEVRVVIDPTSGSDAWLLRRVEEATRKRVVAAPLDDLLGAAENETENETENDTETQPESEVDAAELDPRVRFFLPSHLG